MNRCLRLAPLVLLSALFVLCVPISASGPTAQPKDIVDTAIAAGSFKTLVAAVQAADLVEQLRSSGPFTVFAPTDEAFAKIPKADLDALIKDKAKLAKVLLHHVFVGSARIGILATLKDLSVADGGRLSIVSEKGTLRIGGGLVISPDVVASNGIIHVVDMVLLPK